MLNRLGFRHVETARDGRECLELMQSQELDLVFLDMQMPELSGYDVVRQIRKRAAWRDLPVIAITANAMIGDDQKCFDAGCTAYIAKPLSFEKFRRILKVHLPSSQPES